MDINTIKQKLANLQPKQQKEKVDYKKIFFKPTVGKHTIRIVPSKFDPASPFKEVFVYYGMAKFPIYSLKNWGEKDPIEDFAAELRKTNNKDNWALANKISPKMRIMVPVVVRGFEQDGVRLWEVGKEIYKQLLGIAEDEDYGDYTNIEDGRDFTIDAVASVTGTTKGVSCSIRIKPKTSQLHSDPELVEKLLNDQIDVLSIQKKHTFDELKTILQNWLNPEEEEVAADETETDDDAGIVLVDNQPKHKPSRAKDFNSLFEEENN